MIRKIFVGIHILFPVMLIFILPYVAFSNPDDLFTQSLIVSTLLIYFPILFFLQGVACSLLRANILISISFSLVAFFIVLLIWLNSSAIGYIVVYLIIGFFWIWYNSACSESG